MIVLAVNYNPGPPPPGWHDPTHGRIARYAWAADYHDVLKPRLYALDAFIRQRTGRTTQGKACVDTAPLLERDFAEQAGLGFSGRNTCLITPGLGSWTFLAALLVPEALESGRRTTDDSRYNRRVVGRRSSPAVAVHPLLDACPTGAFVAPTATPVAHILDARRCISYLTIELRGPIPRELRPLMGNWVFGCDVCQAVCPYNRAAPAVTSDADGILSGVPQQFADARRRVPATLLLDLLTLDEAAFRTRFRGSAVLRAKRAARCAMRASRRVTGAIPLPFPR